MEWIIVIGKFLAVVTGLAAITAALLKLSRYDKWARAPKSELDDIPAVYRRGDALGRSQARQAAVGKDIAVALTALVLLLALIMVAIIWGPFNNFANALLITLAGLLALVAYLRLGSH